MSDFTRVEMTPPADGNVPAPAAAPTPPATPPANPPAPAGTPPATPPVTPEVKAGENPEEPKFLVSSNLVEQVSAEIIETGAVKPETLETFKKLGIQPEVVQRFIQAETQVQQFSKDIVVSELGGEQGSKTVRDWAIQNLSADQKQLFDSALWSGDLARVRKAAADLKSAYIEANGNVDNITPVAGQRGIPSIQPFRDRSEATAAIRDPRYKTSEAYRAEVARRRAMSNF
jgi:hypothetical protein